MQQDTMSRMAASAEEKAENIHRDAPVHMSRGRCL